MRPSSAIQCPAKVNLGLWIHGKRPDGFHELTTIFQEIPLHDSLELSVSKTPGSFECSAFPGGENLAFRAWKLLEKKTGRSLPCSIHLVKRIPDQAGLGGGSSDATRVLTELNRCFQLNLKDEQLEIWASELGSDTSFFVRGGCQVGRGRGEKLEPLPSSYKGLLVLGVPLFGCETRAVYARLKPKLTPSPPRVTMISKALETHDLQGLETLMTNDLLAPALEAQPLLAPFMRWLEGFCGSKAFLSGSGSSAFCLLRRPLPAPPTYEGRLLTLLDVGGGKALWEVRS